MGSSRNRATKPKMCTVSISGCLYIGTLKEEDTINLLRKQNRLTDGELSNPRFKPLVTKGCRLLTFTACPVLAAKIGELPNNSGYLGFNKVKIHTKLRDEVDHTIDYFEVESQL